MDYDKMITIVRNIKDLSVEAEKMFHTSSEEEVQETILALALKSERLTDYIRKTAIVSMGIDKDIYLAAATETLGFSVERVEDKIHITLPYLLPKNKSVNSDRFIVEPLSYILQRFVNKYNPRKFYHPLVEIRSIYDNNNPRHIRDTDNVEIHHVINIISTMLFVDDSGVDILLCSRKGESPHTEITISPTTDCE